jgi:hypothetical protein
MSFKISGMARAATVADDDRSTFRNVKVKYRLICILFYEYTLSSLNEMDREGTCSAVLG